MNITLSPEIQRLIQEKVDRGDYSGPEDVVSRAIQLLIEEDRKLDRLRELIDEGDRAVRDGRVRPWTPEVRADINRCADELVARREVLDSDDWS